MRRVMALLCLLTLAGTAWGRYDPYRADTEYGGYANSLAYRFGLFGTVGYGGYAMDDENQFIDSLNSSSGGGAINEITGGVSWGLGMDYGLGDNFIIGAEYEALGAGTHGSLAGGPTTRIDLPASEFGAFFKLALPYGNDWLFDVGLGLYSLWVSNVTEKNIPTPTGPQANTFYGSTMATKLWAGGEYFLTPHVSVGADAGYRFAKISRLTDQYGVLWVNPDGSNLTFDYSGPFARGSLNWHF